MLEWTATLPRGSRRSRRRIESSPRIACICSKTVAPGGGGTPATTTFPTSPPAWQPTTVIVRRARILRATITASASDLPPSVFGHERAGAVLALPDADGLGTRDVAVPALQVQARLLRGRPADAVRREGWSARGIRGSQLNGEAP